MPPQLLRIGRSLRAYGSTCLFWISGNEAFILNFRDSESYGDCTRAHILSHRHPCLTGISENHGRHPFRRSLWRPNFVE